MNPHRILLLSLLLAACTRGETAEGPPGSAEEPAPADAPIRLSPEAVKAAELQIAPARRETLGHTVVAPARLAFQQDGVATVAARVPGRITRLPVKIGDAVKEGQALAEIESAELGRARADYLAARTHVEVARSRHEREKQLLAKGISSEQETREAEAVLAAAKGELQAADARLHALGLSEREVEALDAARHAARLTLRSPIAGTVTELPVVLGQSLEATSPVATVGDLHELWALVDVAERDVVRVRAGQAAVVELAAVPGTTFAGKVENAGAAIDEKSRTALVRVAVPNPEATLRPGMFATARIETGAPAVEGPGQVIVPREAVQSVEGRDVVFVQSAPGEFRPVAVQVGLTTAADAQILSGLQGGEPVVTTGAFILKSELSRESLGEE